jgi:hypothetical protein
VTDIKKELINFEMHCLETDQLQVAELQSNAVKRITELEKELSLTKDIIVAHQIADETGYIDGVGWVENWSEMEGKVSNLLEAHNLEQQAKGCFESILEIDAYSKNGSSFVLVRDVNNFGVKKQLQAEALKEQVK